ncbi:hybrid sensor histidine kinase/response regulator [Hansschlegelia sp.]|uniref:hybrid sensor histidine kinase/response regulator n=1 Tax=Hansschlegelia sp. TaxID=2041892 RepID=UPI002CF961D9|nr:ATP-binding protein [Hansschlegelia sp.]HVI28025.1 ATP-binding protein [Hansschlegelia sp.]
MTRRARGTAAQQPPARPSVLRWLVARLKNRPDGEHEMALNRLVLALLVLGYLSVQAYEESNPFTRPFEITAIFALGALGFLVHMLWRPGSSLPRRALAMVFDFAGISYCLHAGGALTAIIYPTYLWVIFGNGFRFGIPSLLAAASVAIASFAVVIATTRYWHDNLGLSLGLLFGLLILPAYAATLIKKLQRAKLAAEEASRAKSQFLASVSHELRTPLNAVIGLTDLLDATELDAEQRDMVRTTGESGRVLLGLIDELLTFSRIEAGRMPTNIVDFDLHELLAGVRGLLMTQARGKNLRFGIHATPRTPYRLRGESRQIRDVLLNLAGNAVKFTEQGGVVVSVDLVGGSAERPRLRFEVTDTGIGIAPEARTRIFESFTQADETIINSYGGTGLGLAICKQFVEHQGGTIELESEPGVGSTFAFELDLEAAAEPSAIPDRLEAQVVALAPREAAAAALAEALRDIGVEAAPAVDVRSALRLLRAQPGGRRVVVVEAQPGEPDAEALASAIRAADTEELVEIALIDPSLGAGLPDVDLRLLCAAAAARPTPGKLAAMVRAASAGSGGRAGVRRVAGQTKVADRRLAILVAEDNRTNQKVITKILERAGHEVRIADNGELALDALTERQFDLVLMDVNMPVLDGIECAKLYRFASIGKTRVPIVALTADATPAARERCLDAGMDACLTKPIEPDRLLAMIDEITAGAPGLATAEAEQAAAESQTVDDELVANIAEHPNFRPARRAVVDKRTLSDLEDLGGREFVGDLVGEFIGEAAGVLKALQQAVQMGEPSAFREQAHALRSGAANIGARGIYEICLSCRNIDARELAAHGAERVSRLEAEFERVRKTLLRQFPDREERQGEGG